MEKRQGEKGKVARTVEHGAEASIEQRPGPVDGRLETLAQAGLSPTWREAVADVWVDAWLRSLAEAGVSDRQRTLHACRLAEAVMEYASPALPTERTWEAFAAWVSAQPGNP